MKITRCWIAVLLGACVGCFTLPTSWPAEKPPDLAALRAAKAGPVTAEQINEINAREKASALQEEIDHDTRGEQAAPVSKGKGGKGKKGKAPAKEEKAKDSADQ